MGKPIEIEGLEAVFSRFKQLREGVEDFGAKDTSGIGWLIARHLHASTNQRFMEERDPDGKVWEGLKDSTLARKKRKGFAPRILKERLTLLRSIDTEVTAQAIIIGTKVKYAAAHQFGVSKRNLPQRAFLGMSNDDRTAIHDLLVKYFEGL